MSLRQHFSNFLTLLKIGELDNLPRWLGAAWPGGSSSSGIVVGCSAYLNEEVIIDAPGMVRLSFAGEYFDKADIHDPIVEPNKFIVPAGYNYANFKCYYELSSGALDVVVCIIKNDVPWTDQEETGSGLPWMAGSIESLFIPVVAGDIFELQIQNLSVTDPIFVIGNANSRKTRCTLELTN